MHPALVTQSRTSLTTRLEVVMSTPTSETTTTLTRLDLFLVIIVLIVIVVLTVTPTRFIIYYNCSVNYCLL
jgi:hypothetical protein